MDRLHQLEIFVAAAERSSLVAAARHLRISGPAVTRAINALESEVGARLLLRTTRTVTLTAAGARFLDQSRAILSLMQEAEREAAGERVSPRGRLTVTASVTFGRLHVAPLLLEFLRDNEEVTGSLLLVDRVVNLTEESVDLAFRIGDLPDSSLHARRLGMVRRLLVASPAYLDRRGRPQVPAELAGHDVIAFSSLTPGAEWRMREDDAWRRVALRPRLEVTDASTAVACALAGGGITVAMSYLVADAVKSGALELVLAPFLPPAVPVHAVTTDAQLLPARVRCFLDFATPRLVGALAAA